MARRVRKLCSTIDSSTKSSSTFVITGPSAGGLGAQTAIELAAANLKEIVLAGRTRAKVPPVVEAIQRVNPKIRTVFVELDLADLSSVRRAAETIKGNVAVIDVLFDNARVMAAKDYNESADGYELQFASNHLRHFLLANWLAEKLFAAA